MRASQFIFGVAAATSAVGIGGAVSGGIEAMLNATHYITPEQLIQAERKCTGYLTSVVDKVQVSAHSPNIDDPINAAVCKPVEDLLNKEASQNESDRRQGVAAGVWVGILTLVGGISLEETIHQNKDIKKRSQKLQEIVLMSTGLNAKDFMEGSKKKLDDNKHDGLLKIDEIQALGDHIIDQLDKRKTTSE
ncbi:MAG TPA: hypothetical protein VLF90_02775 [Patescibacteria group bacterium]|nr:hypothetical protein [Patescibacteria group bacterium]